MSPELRPIKCAAMAALCLTLSLSTLDAFAQAGGQPLILDTQTGIHSGAGGTVLQTGPLNGSGMVPAHPMAKLPELPQQDQQTIIVSPYIDLQQGGHHDAQGYGSPTGSQAPSNYRHRPHSASSHSGASYGVPIGAQTPASALTQPAVPQAPKSPGQQPPIITPISVATPKTVATPNPVATVPTRSSNPRTVSGSVTTSLD